MKPRTLRNLRRYARLAGRIMEKPGCWRMPAKCADCPFAESGAGLHMRQSLHPDRFPSICRDLDRGAYFICHKTARGTGDGSNRYCAGALEYQDARGIVAPYRELCERLDEQARARGMA